jgi:hypothetical protein
MSGATKRSIVRWIHLVLAIPIIGYIYSPFDQIPNYAPATRFVFVPMLVLSLRSSSFIASSLMSAR